LKTKKNQKPNRVERGREEERKMGSREDGEKVTVGIK
jgi:hypothetical protein